MTETAKRVEALARTALLVERDIYPSLNGGSIADELLATSVTLQAGAESLGNPAGQTALVTAAIVVAQLGVQLQLDFEEVKLVVSQPPLRGEGLRESLLDLTADLITPATVGHGGEFAVAIGTDATGPGVALAGNDFAFQLAAEAVGDVRGQLPFGAGLGAAACGAEVFRHVMRRIGAERELDALREHPLQASLPASHSLQPFAWNPADLGRVDSISAGALTTAFLYLALRVPGLAMQLRVIDQDCGALANLNRYLLLRRGLLEMPKVEALATFSTDAVEIEPIPMRFDETTQTHLSPLAPVVVVGVDHIPSRWRAQRAAGGWLGVAATSHFEVVVSEHTRESPCAGCLHPHDDDGGGEIPTVSFVSAFSGFLLAYRLARFVVAGGSPSQTLAYPFSLGGERAIWDYPLAAHGLCPCGCDASRRLARAASDGDR